MHRVWILAVTMTTAALAFDNTYQAYAGFLADYVCPEGVSYSTIAGDERLESIAADWEQVTRKEFESWSETEQIAFLINEYNFHTIALIARHYPLKTGIRDIDKPWDQEFVTLFGEPVSLNHIEHKVLRKQYNEPRIHFALNCASESCPPLVETPFTGAKLDEQLDAVASSFLNDSTRNRLEGGKLYLSKIFQWYGGDFKGTYGGYEQYVSQVLGLKEAPRVKFLEYDWSLNEAPPCRK